MLGWSVIAPSTFHKETADFSSPNDWLMSSAIELLLCMICGFENGTNGCHLAVFGVDVAFACHFVAINCLHPCRSACDIGYISENSKMAGNFS